MKFHSLGINRLCGLWEMLRQSRIRFTWRNDDGLGNSSCRRVMESSPKPEALSSQTGSSAEGLADGRRSCHGSSRFGRPHQSVLGRLKRACSQPASHAHGMYEASCALRRIYSQGRDAKRNTLIPIITIAWVPVRPSDISTSAVTKKAKVIMAPIQTSSPASFRQRVMKAGPKLFFRCLS